MDDLPALIFFIAFILGGSYSLAGTWWANKNKKDAEDE